MTFNADGFARVLHTALREEIEKVVQEEAEKAANEVRRRVGQSVDRLALHLAAEYSVVDMGNVIRIEVKK